MRGTLSAVLKIFFRGIGLKTLLSYIPPSAVAWTFFVLYLRLLSRDYPDEFWTALLLGQIGRASCRERVCLYV